MLLLLLLLLLLLVLLLLVLLLLILLQRDVFGIKHTSPGFGHEYQQRVRCGGDLGAIGAFNLYGSLLGCTAGGLPLLPFRIAPPIVHIRHICHLGASPTCRTADLLALYGSMTQQIMPHSICKTSA